MLPSYVGFRFVVIFVTKEMRTISNEIEKENKGQELDRFIIKVPYDGITNKRLSVSESTPSKRMRWTNGDPNVANND